jgi:hypothetical protein
MGLVDGPTPTAGEDSVAPARVEREQPKAPNAFRDRVAVLIVVLGAPLAMLLWLGAIIWLLMLLF